MNGKYKNMRGEQIQKTLRHDNGAFGQCGKCHRYSDDPHCLTLGYKCQCSTTGYFSGSFKRPTKESLWSDHL